MIHISFQTRQRLIQSRRPGVWALLVVLGLMATPLWAQFSGRLQGTIVDSSGAVVPNAALTLINPATNQQIQVTSSASGDYHFESLGPGTYQLTAKATGFQTQQIAVTVTTQQVASVEVKLNVAQASNTVEVTSTAADLDPQENRVETTLSAETVRTLPLQNRGTLNLEFTAPGVSGYTENLDNFQNEETPNANANGHFSGSNLYIIDGISSTSNVTGGTNNVTPNPDSLEEIAVQTNTFTPDFAGGAGITTELTTKAGSNRFHGAGEYSFYNQNLQARSYFVPIISKYKQIEYSGVLGGPIYKDKTFFESSVEKKAATNPATTSFISSEDPALLSLLQTNYPNTVGTSLLTRYPTAGINRLGVRYYTSADLTQTCQVVTGTCNIPFIDNVSQTAAPYNNGLQYSLRLDQLLRGGKDRIFAYYFHIDHQVQVIDPRPQFSSVNVTTSNLYHINYTHSFSPNLLNEASFAYARVNGNDSATVPSIPDISINNATAINGFGGGFGPGSFVQHNYNWRDVFTLVRGRHDLRLGVEIDHANDTADFSGIYARPTFSFNSLGDFIQDNVFQESNISYNPLNGGTTPLQFGVANNSFGGFAQDIWKVTPKLTLDLGLRWDDFGNPYAFGYAAFPNIGNLIPSGPSTELLAGSAIDGQFANASIRTSRSVLAGRLRNNWAPRIGFSYAPTSSGTLSLHGGVGLYHDQITLGQIVDQLRGNPPTAIFPVFGQQEAIPSRYVLGTTNAAPPYGFVYPTIQATGVDVHGGIPGANAGVQGIDPNVITPATINYTLGISQQASYHFIFGITYGGSYSPNQLSATDFNRSAGDLIRNNGTLNRLNPSFGGITYAGNFDQGNYNSVIFSATQTIGKLSYQASYTFSHALDYGNCGTRYTYSNGSNGAQTTDCPADQHQLGTSYYGSSSFDEPNNFKVTGSYELPSPHERLLKSVAGGWQVTTLIVAQSGTPFTAFNYANYSASCLTANTGNTVQCGDYNADGYNIDLPNIATAKRGGKFSHSQYINGVFNRDAQGRTTEFTAPTPGTEGDESRNQFRNPRLFEFDASVLKNTSLPWFGGERADAQLRLDGFNVVNHTNLGTVDYDVSHQTFGQALSTLQPRILQLGARFSF